MNPVRGMLFSPLFYSDKRAQALNEFFRWKLRFTFLLGALRDAIAAHYEG